MDQRRIMLVSDGTGETAGAMVDAAMVQFPKIRPQYTRQKNVRTIDQVEAICESAAINKELIVFTLVSPGLRKHIRKRAIELELEIVDLLGPLLSGLGTHFGYEPKAVAGLLHDVDEKYFERVEAMEYTIAHDDGRDVTGLEKADLVILGISRTSKTPLSMYLSHQGWRVANIPMIVGYDIPKEIYDVDPKRVIGLTINPDELAQIRRARLKRLGQEAGGNYAEPVRVQSEVEFARDLFKKNRKWTVFNVTGKALEETASEIIKLMTARRLNPSITRDY